MPKLSIKLSKDTPQKQSIHWDAKELLHQKDTNKLIKGVSTQIVINGKQLTITDISLKHKGFEEDEVFASDSNIHQNITRGLSVLKYDGKVQVIRRGLKKFFDVQFTDLVPSAEINNALQWILRQYTLQAVEKELNTGEEVYVSKMEKANGENAQISYVRELDTWVVASKNVSLLAHSVQDLAQDIYTKSQRYFFALLIGKAWFDQISNLQEEQVLELKQILSSTTFVGEYCGNQNFQHLVRYQGIQIKFYAIVENESQSTCISPLRAHEIFTRFELKQVSRSIQKTNCTVEFYEIMRNHYKEVGSKSVEEEGEGAVIYLYGENAMYSLCKLKTLEYRLFRKLREKLKSLLFRKKDAKTTHKRYVHECEELQQFVRANKPQEYYNVIAMRAMLFVQRFTESADAKSLLKIKHFISSKFIDFLQYFQSESLNEKQLYQEIADLELVNTDSDNEQQEETKSQEQSNKTVLVIYPLMIPGAGKSTILQQLKSNESKEESKDQSQEQSKEQSKNYTEIYSISSDDIRKACIDDYMKQNPKTDTTEVYKKTQKLYAASYEREVLKAINEANNSKNNRIIIFLDKNHPLHSKYELDKIKDHFNKIEKANIHHTGLISHCLSKFQQYPFSLSHLLSCLKRTLDRQNHQTLKGDKTNIINIVLRFFTLYSNLPGLLNQVFKKELIEIPCDVEKEVPLEMQDLLGQMLHNFNQDKNHNYSEASSEIQKLTQFLEKWDHNYPAASEQNLMNLSIFKS